MSGFDADHVYTVSVHDPPPATSPDSLSETEKLLLNFLLQYRVGGEFIYRQVYYLGRVLASSSCNLTAEINYEPICCLNTISSKLICVISHFITTS